MAENTSASGKRPGLLTLLLIVGLAAVAVRAVFFVEFLHDLPYYRSTHRGTDMHTYRLWAERVGEGDLLSRHRGPFYYTPLYAYALGGVYALSGTDGVVPGMVLNALFGVAAALCAAGLARRLFGWWAGLTGGLLMALNGSQICVEGVTLVDGLLPALLLGALWLVVELLDRDASPAWWLAPGGLLGLATVGRGSNLLVAAALGVLLLVGLGRRRGWGRSAAACLLLAVGFALPLVPPVLRNGLMHGRWTVTTNGPVMLYIGNRPGAPGVLYTPGDLSRQAARERSDGYWMGRLADELREDAWSLPATMWRKVQLFFNAWDVPGNLNYHFVRRYVTSLRLLTVGPLVLYVLGFVGLTVTALRWRRLVPLCVFGGSFALSIILVLVDGRYKLPFLGLLAVFAGAGLVTLAGRLRRGEWEVPFLSVVLAGLLTLLFWPRGPTPFLDRNCPLRANEYRVNAMALIRAERDEDAEDMLDDASLLFPADARFAVLCAKLHLQDGEAREALTVLERPLERGIFDEEAMELRVHTYRELGREEDMRRAARELLHRHPGNQTARRALGR